MIEPGELIVSEALRHFNEPTHRLPGAFFYGDDLNIARGAAHHAVQAEKDRRGTMSNEEYEELTKTTCDIVLKLSGINPTEQEN